jgi:hypothetical protein
MARATQTFFSFKAYYEQFGRAECITRQVDAGKSLSAATRSVDRMKRWHIDGIRDTTARPGTDVEFVYTQALANTLPDEKHGLRAAKGARLGLLTDDIDTARAYAAGFGGNPIYGFVWSRNGVAIYISENSDDDGIDETFDAVADNSNLDDLPLDSDVI